MICCLLFSVVASFLCFWCYCSNTSAAHDRPKNFSNVSYANIQIQSVSLKGKMGSGRPNINPYQIFKFFIFIHKWLHTKWKMMFMAAATAANEKVYHYIIYRSHIRTIRNVRPSKFQSNQCISDSGTESIYVLFPTAWFGMDHFEFCGPNKST